MLYFYLEIFKKYLCRPVASQFVFLAAKCMHIVCTYFLQLRMAITLFQSAIGADAIYWGAITHYWRLLENVTLKLKRFNDVMQF